MDKDDCSISSLEQIIKHDVAMTNKLLKKVNTVYYSPVGRQINSISHALALLDLLEIKKWIAIVMLQSVADTEGEQIIFNALTRAIFS